MPRTLKELAKTSRQIRSRLANIAAALTLIALPAGLLLGQHAANAAEAAGAEELAKAVFNHSTYSSPIAISRDNRLVWVVNSRDDTVSVIRTDTHAVLKTIAVGDEPRSIALDPNNTFAFVSNAAGSSVTVIKINNATLRELRCGGGRRASRPAPSRGTSSSRPTASASSSPIAARTPSP